MKLRSVRRWLYLATGFAGLLLGAPAVAQEDSPEEVLQEPTGPNPLRLGTKPIEKPRGRWVEWRGGVKWEGEYLDGQRDGVWSATSPIVEDSLFAGAEYDGFESPVTITVTLHLNVAHGEVSAIDAQQRPMLSCHLDQGVLEGKATWWHANGQSRRMVTYRAGLLDGPVTEWNKDGKITRQETYREGRGSSSHIEWYTPGRKHYEGYSHLPGEVTRDSFEWLELRWTQATVDGFPSDERCGRWIAWYPNGQKKVQGGYQYGTAEGRFTWWHDNGQKQAEGEYVAGKRHGMWRFWHANGRKHMEGDFSYGETAEPWQAWNAEGRPSVVEPAMNSLALDWDQGPIEVQTAKRAIPATRPMLAQTPSSPSTAVNQPRTATKSHATGKKSTPPATNNNTPEPNAGVFPGLLPGPVANNTRRAAPTSPHSAPSDEFTLLGMFKSEGSPRGASQSELFKTRKSATSDTTTAPPSKSSPRPSSSNGPRNVVAEMLGLESAPTGNQGRARR